MQGTRSCQRPYLRHQKQRHEPYDERREVVLEEEGRHQEGEGGEREEGERGLCLQEPAGHAIQILAPKQAAAGDGSSRS
jgi:hypothetical protein